jgi:chorismate-pyruvate lyase
MRSVLDQATNHTRRALRDLEAACTTLEDEGQPPVGEWVDAARGATQGAVRVLEAYRATVATRRRRTGTR